MLQNHLWLVSILHLENKADVQNWHGFTILDYVLRHCSFLDKKVLPSVLVSVFFSGFLTNAIWIRIETSTLATTVATVGKSGNLPVASFEYTFDHVADVDDDDNGDDVGDDDNDDDFGENDGVDDNFGEVRDDDVGEDEDGDDDADDNVSEVHDDDVSEDDDTNCEGETLGT